MDRDELRKVLTIVDGYGTGAGEKKETVDEPEVASTAEVAFYVSPDCRIRFHTDLRAVTRKQMALLLEGSNLMHTQLLQAYIDNFGSGPS